MLKRVLLQINWVLAEGLTNRCDPASYCSRAT